MITRIISMIVIQYEIKISKIRRNRFIFNLKSWLSLDERNIVLQKLYSQRIKRRNIYLFKKEEVSLKFSMGSNILIFFPLAFSALAYM